MSELKGESPAQGVSCGVCWVLLGFGKRIAFPTGGPVGLADFLPTRVGPEEVFMDANGEFNQQRVAVVAEAKREQVAQGDIRLIYGCRLRLEPGWEACRPGLCASRPCWVARSDDSGVLVLPFSKDLWRSPLHFRKGQGGLNRDSALLHRPVRISATDLGPRVGRLDVEEVKLAFGAAWEAVLTGIVTASPPVRDEWLQTLALILGPARGDLQLAA